jgi:hypothetical protein
MQIRGRRRLLSSLSIAKEISLHVAMEKFKDLKIFEGKIMKIAEKIISCRQNQAQ